MTVNGDAWLCLSMLGDSRMIQPLFLRHISHPTPPDRIRANLRKFHRSRSSRGEKDFEEQLEEVVRRTTVRWTRDVSMRDSNLTAMITLIETDTGTRYTSTT